MSEKNGLKLLRIHTKMIVLFNLALPEKCPNTEFFLVRIFLYSVQIQENADQEKLRIWTLFTQCRAPKIIHKNMFDKWKIFNGDLILDGGFVLVDSKVNFKK